MPWLNVLLANIRKVGIEMIRYLPNTISSIITFYAIFLMFFLGIQVVGNPETQGSNTQYMIASMVLWFLALMAMQGIGWEITTEATRGTLEQLYMSPVPAWHILLSRMMGTIAVNMLVIVLVLLLAMLTSGQWLRFDLFTLLPMLFLLLVGMVGVGFMVAGLALVYKQIQAFLQIAQFIFLGLVSVPVGLSVTLEFLPIVRGSSMVREALVSGLYITDFAVQAWLLLAANSLFYFVLGILLYKLAEGRAFSRGLLGQY